MAKKIITNKDTQYVANLIKVYIPEKELAKYTKQLNTVLEAVEVMNELDTQEVGTTSQTHGLQNILREDEVESGINMENYQNKLNFQDDYFVVKKVI